MKASWEKEKGLIAESHDWVDEPTSESEKDTSNVCLMAKIRDMEYPEGQVPSTALVSTKCSSSTSSAKYSQVHPFFSLSDSEKIEVFDSLTIDLHNVKGAKKKFD